MTGAEALQKIMDTVDTLKATVDELKISVQLIEANIKVLNNRAAGLMRENVQPAYPTIGSRLTASVGANPVSAGVPEQKSQQVIQTAAAPNRGRQLIETPEEKRSEAMNIIKEDSPGVLTYKKVFGRLVNNSSEPIEGVLIKVFDRNNEISGTAETDPIGYWETMLKPGRYVAEYTKAGFKTTNKTFDVSKSAKEVEVK